MTSGPPPLPPSLPKARPSILGFYRGWCWFFVVLWLAMATWGILQLSRVIDPDLGIIEGILVKDDAQARAALIEEKRADAIGVVAISILGAGFYGFAACVPRRPWAWVVGMIAIVGSTFPFLCTVAGTIPLLLGWLKPEAKSYFNQR